MIDCAIGSFIDNQRAVGYPIGYVSRQWADFRRLFWFTSDAENRELLEKERESHPMADRIVIVEIGIHIQTPADLMRVYPACVERLQHAGCKFVALQEADLVLTDFGIEAIRDQIENRRVMGIPAMQNKLYCETYDNPHGCVVLPSESKYTMGNTDWEVYVDSVPWLNWDLKHESGARLMLDLGYFGTDAYYRKLENHGRLWPNETWKVHRAAFDRSAGEGIRLALDRVRSECGQIKMIPLDEQYQTLLDDLGLRVDWSLVYSEVELMQSLAGAA